MSAQDSADQDLLREQIQSAIAAGRDLGPDMDKHLVDSVLSQYTKERAAREKAVAKTQGAPSLAMPRQNTGGEIAARIVGTLAMAGVATAVLIVHPEFFWLLFIFLPMLGGVWGGGWHGHHSRRYSYNSNGAHGDANDYDLRQQERATRRRLKIQHMEAEISRLKKQRDSDFD